MVVGSHLVIRAAPSCCLLGGAIAIEFPGTAHFQDILIMRHMGKGCWTQDTFINTQYYVMENIAVYQKSEEKIFGLNSPLVVKFLWEQWQVKC